MKPKAGIRDANPKPVSTRRATTLPRSTAQAHLATAQKSWPDWDGGRLRLRSHSARSEIQPGISDPKPNPVSTRRHTTAIDESIPHLASGPGSRSTTQSELGLRIGIATNHPIANLAT